MTQYALPPHVPAVDFLVDHVYRASDLMDALLGALRDQGKPAVLPQLEVRATCQVMPGADEVFELTHQLCFAPALARAVRARLCELLGEAHPSLEVEVRPDRRTGIASLRVIPAANHSGGIGALEYAH